MQELKYNEPWIMQRADPYIYKHESGMYYFTASVPAYDKIILRESDTLEGLADATEHEIWHKHDTGIMGNHIWAPELHYLNQKWYIYFAAGDAEDKWNIRPYVLECADADPVRGIWRELGKMQCADEDEFSFRSFSLDATVFENHGKYYYVWAEKVGVGKMISNLYIAEMETPNKLKTVQVMLTTPDYDWERVDFWVNEGPAVIKRNGRRLLSALEKSTLLILPARQALLTAWVCSQQMRMLICLILYPGEKSDIRYWLLMNPEQSMDLGIIPLQQMKREMIFSYIMREKRR